MSKPNLLAYSTSIGYHRNKRVRELRELLAGKIKIKVDFCELAPEMLSILMAYAGENQTDGDYSTYSMAQIQEVFANNNRPMTMQQTKIVWESLHEVGLLEDGKIRSWKKYNRHLACYEQDKKAKIKAGKERQKQRANGKPHSDDLPTARAHTSSTTATASVPENDERTVVVSGKRWFISDARKEVKRIETDIATLKKNKPDTANGDPEAVRTMFELYIAKLNGLESDLAAFRSALFNREVKPELHKVPQFAKSKAAAPALRDRAVNQLNEEEIKQELSNIREDIEGILRPSTEFRDRLFPKWENYLERLRRREGELSRRLTSIAGDLVTA